jgi:DNA-binding NarL/FixJ family response regulator
MVNVNKMQNRRKAKFDVHGTGVIVIEDHQLVAEFFSLHCRAMRLNVLGCWPTLAQGMAAVRAQRPALVLMDFSLPDGSGLDAAATILKEFPTIKIVGISSHRDPWTLLQVQRLALHGFVDKHEQRPEILTEAITAVLDGRIYYTPIVNEAIARLRRDPNAFVRFLSEYEMRILSLIGESKTDDEIAEIFEISPATAQSRRRDIMRKLDIHTTPKLIHFAIVNGLTRADQLGVKKEAAPAIAASSARK